MKLPRDLSGEDLTRLLRRYGYEITRQSSSHIRMKQPPLAHVIGTRRPI